MPYFNLQRTLRRHRLNERVIAMVHRPRSSRGRGGTDNGVDRLIIGPRSTVRAFVEREDDDDCHAAGPPDSSEHDQKLTHGLNILSVCDSRVNVSVR